jgi:hypothetical protein
MMSATANGLNHCTIGTTVNLAIRRGLIRHVKEWGPGDAQIAAKPDLVESRERPSFPLITAWR